MKMKPTTPMAHLISLKINGDSLLCNLENGIDVRMLSDKP